MSSENAAAPLSPQQIIEYRLDDLDRVLLGLVPRSERLAIVSQVEAKVKAHGDSAAALVAGATAELPVRPTARARSERRPRSRVALSAGILGIIAVALLFATPFVYGAIMILEDMVGETAQIAILGTHVSAVALGGFLAVVLGLVAIIRISRSRGATVGHGWAIAGLCTGPIPMLMGGLVALLIGMQWSQSIGSAGPVMSVTTTYSPSPYGASPECVDGSCAPPLPASMANLPPAGYAAAPVSSVAPATAWPTAAETEKAEPARESNLAPAPAESTATPAAASEPEKEDGEETKSR
jgi:hypothetical protein